MSGRFGTVLTAMVTPFDADGALDLDAAATVARFLQEQGNDGLVVAGTTGEASVLSDDEHLSLLAAVAEAVTIPVVAGTGSNDTRHAVEMTARVSDLGVAGVLVYELQQGEAQIRRRLQQQAQHLALVDFIHTATIRAAVLKRAGESCQTSWTPSRRKRELALESDGSF